MNYKAILGISLAAVFAVSMTIIPAMAAGHLTIDDSTVYQTGGKLNAVIHTSAPIPIPAPGAGPDFGYAFPISDGSGLLAVTTHGAIGDDSGNQNSATDPVFHTHIVTAGPSAVCPSGTEVTSVTNNEVGKATVSGSFVVINNIPTGQVPGLINTPLAFPLSAVGTTVCVG